MEAPNLKRLTMSIDLIWAISETYYQLHFLHPCGVNYSFNLHITCTGVSYSKTLWYSVLLLNSYSQIFLFNIIPADNTFTRPDLPFSPLLCLPGFRRESQSVMRWFCLSDTRILLCLVTKSAHQFLVYLPTFKTLLVRVTHICALGF